MKRLNEFNGTAILSAMMLLLLLDCSHDTNALTDDRKADRLTKDQVKTAEVIHAGHYEPEKLVVLTNEVDEALRKNYSNPMWLSVLTGLFGGPIGGAILANNDSDSRRDRGMKILTTVSEQMIKTYQLEDPVSDVQKNFLLFVTPEIDPSKVQVSSTPIIIDDPKELMTAFGSGVLIDFKTLSWGILFMAPSDRRLNQVVYAARARAVDLHAGKVLWQGGQCDIRDSKTKPPVRTDELIADSADLLKVRLREAANACVRALTLQYMGNAVGN